LARVLLKSAVIKVLDVNIKRTVLNKGGVASSQDGKHDKHGIDEH